MTVVAQDESPRRGPLRVALVAGTLARGGAEKQSFYMARALHAAGVDVRTFGLTRGEHFEAELTALGVPVTWIGDRSEPPLRLLALRRALARFRPHVLQSTHFYTNLYVALQPPASGSVAIGAIRNDALHDVAANGRWGRWLLRLPRGLLANSEAAESNARSLGARPERLRVLWNVIDLARFDAEARAPLAEPLFTAPTSLLVVAVARLAPEKRLDRLLTALAVVRRELPTVRAVLVGDGPERSRLTTLADGLGLLPDGLRLLGHRPDVAAILRASDVLVLTSDHEGFPNVILEAMAASRPVVTTPAGDAALVVEHERTGLVLPFDDGAALAERLLQLARAPDWRRGLGAAGRARAEARHDADHLAPSLLGVYREFARQQRCPSVADRLG